MFSFVSNVAAACVLDDPGRDQTERRSVVNVLFRGAGTDHL